MRVVLSLIWKLLVPVSNVVPKTAEYTESQSSAITYFRAICGLVQNVWSKDETPLVSDTSTSWPWKEMLQSQVKAASAPNRCSVSFGRTLLKLLSDRLYPSAYWKLYQTRVRGMALIESNRFKRLFWSRRPITEALLAEARLAVGAAA